MDKVFPKSDLASVVGIIIFSPKYLLFNSWDLGICYDTQKMGIKVEDEIKVTNQLTLKYKDYPGLPKWDQCNHKDP